MIALPMGSDRDGNVTFHQRKGVASARAVLLGCSGKLGAEPGGIMAAQLGRRVTFLPVRHVGASAGTAARP
jgi:hypothetical protein